MRHIFYGLLLTCFFCATANASSIIDDQCMAKGIKLYGKVQAVDSFADITVQKVTGLPDLRVQEVDSLPTRCGEWEWVDALPDFTVQFVDSFPEITIEFVDALPGRR